MLEQERTAVPSHVTHMIFGKEVLAGLHIPLHHRQWFYLGCQGPDLFLHNQRTAPKALSWGRELHSSGYGDYTAELIADSHAAGEWSSPLGMYILGFITHAFLDRHAHPYIEAWSGRGRDRRYAHPFLERLIDVQLFHLREGRNLAEISCYRLISLGQRAPDQLVKLLSTAAWNYFPRRLSGDAEAKVINAYHDTMGLLKLTDSWDPEHIRKHVSRRDIERAKRLIALFHPPQMPIEMDVFNCSRSPWGLEKGNGLSFLDLFEKAKVVCTEAVRRIIHTGYKDDQGIAQIVGNEGLNGGIVQGNYTGVPTPLPLPEALEELYRSVFYQSPP